MKKILLCLVLIVSLEPNSHAQAVADKVQKEKIQFKATDDVMVTADQYIIDSKAPLIILYHQAMFGRGEYVSIAPKLNALGFNCLAVDQRSGNGVNGIKNETKRSAANLGKKTKYVNAIPDVEGALLYSKEKLNPKQIIIWGSSYSAALVFYLASQYPKDIAALLAFSPSEYFKISDKEIKSYAENLTCPVFITSSKSERKNWQGIYDVIKSEKAFFLPTQSGFHGSKALWPSKSGNEAYWTAVEEFLLKVKE